MDGFAGESAQGDNRLGWNSTDGDLFDASQYAFFGGDVVEEVELGGLEDEEELPALGFNENLYEVDYEEDASFRPLNEIDDLTNSISELDSGIPTVPRVVDHRLSIESSTVAEWPKEVDYPAWFDQHGLLTSNSFYRISSHPDPHPQLLHISNPIPVPKSSFPSYPPHGGMPQQGSLKSHLQHPNIPYVTGQSQMSPSQNSSPFPRFLSGSLLNSRLVGNFSQSSPLGHSVNSQPSSQWLNQATYHGEHPNAFNLLQQQSPHQNGMMHQVINHHQQ